MEFSGTASRAWAWVSAAIAGLTTAVYLAAIAAEGNNLFWDVFPWAALMLVGTGAAATAAIIPVNSGHRAFAVSATVILGLIGFITMFSVGLGFLAAAVAAGLARARAQPASRTDQQ